MQAITTAISDAGIQFFGRELIGSILADKLRSMAIPDRDIAIGRINIIYSYAENIRIRLTSGTLSGFSPRFIRVRQGANGAFGVDLEADDFDVRYAWRETYKYTSCSFVPMAGMICQSPKNKQGDYTYVPRARAFKANVETRFAYNAGSDAYEVQTTGSNATSDVAPNIPGGSIINREQQGCFTSNVSDATAKAISSVDFRGAIQQVMPQLLRSIPASGKLTPDITFEFKLGDDKMTFPIPGILIAATGQARWKNELYPGPVPEKLPLPSVPAGKHLRTYVSSYAVNGLYWAYFKAGGLDAIVKPADLTNPDLLRVDTYVDQIEAFQPYAGKVMYAHVSPKVAPAVDFREVWLYDRKVLDSLKPPALSPEAYTAVENAMGGKAYLTEQEARTAATRAGVPPAFIDRVVNAAKQGGMVVEATLGFRLVIQETSPERHLAFSLKRVDVLKDLALGAQGEAQTLKFSFTRVSAKATFDDTNIPDFDDSGFGQFIWPVVGEPRYVEAQQGLGKIGVPIPIMQGFSFRFESAELSVQRGFVSITADVAFKRAALPAEVAQALHAALAAA
ncbi:MAG TPA: hypothetical protein VFF00_06460 [Candidatus Elarobacter sp.]|nr:hypothetical protein [Candidatus Elarobacter sp.]